MPEDGAELHPATEALQALKWEDDDDTPLGNPSYSLSLSACHLRIFQIEQQNTKMKEINILNWKNIVMLFLLIPKGLNNVVPIRVSMQFSSAIEQHRISIWAIIERLYAIVFSQENVNPIISKRLSKVLNAVWN